MVAVISWFVVGVIALLTVVGVLGVLGTSVVLAGRTLTARRANTAPALSVELAVELPVTP